MSCLPKCYFNYSTLTAKVGNIYKGYEELPCIQIPTFKRKVKERESLGNGWYGGMEIVEKVYDKCFIIIKDNKPFGVLQHPYHESNNIKSDILPITHKLVHKEITDYINKTYKP
jgi:hypothetical protein